ncbi:hypothetical protein AB0C10_21475 [Microbispora amethystogenes]|uniref:hypothetical protein n=1 Tax=Microbispora amethystogenes TaxID=1427754 RepID=UPI0033C50DDE
MTSDICVCGRPITDNAVVCRSCGAALHQELVDVASGGLADELDTSLARQARIGGNGPRSSEAPLGYGEAASSAIWVLRTTMIAWILILAEGGDHLPPEVLDEHPPALAQWLAAHTEDVRRHPSAADAVEELITAVQQARDAIDRPAERVYCGPCGAKTDDGTRCMIDLYARQDAGTIQCRCGMIWGVRQRRDWLMAEAEQATGTATEISRAVTGLGREVTPERIWKWASRGRLAVRGRDARGRPLYQVGDVIDLLDADMMSVPYGPACLDCAHRTCRLIRTRPRGKAA